MITVEVWMDIKTLFQQGHSQRAIARLTGHSRNTVSRVLAQKTPQTRQPRQRRSQLDPFKLYIEQRHAEYDLSCVRLLAEIRAMGYAGGIDVIRRYLRSLDPHEHARSKMTVRFETPPGEQAQADWASCGHYVDAEGGRHPVYAFVMVLSYSRMMCVEFTRSMQLPELIRCHQNAFSFFGGWTKTILYDNMKQVRLSPSEFNPLFIDFISHYGISVRTHQPHRPRTKGKVERMVRYLKDNFLNGRAFADIDDLNAQARHWLDTTANIRLHQTTGERPVDLLPHEQLTALAEITPYHLTRRAERTVDAESFVHLGRTRYSVPPTHVGQTVIIECGEQRVVIRSGDLVIAEHLPAPRPGSCMVQKEHVEALWRLSLERRPAPPAPRWQIGLHESVATTPLSTYEEAAR